ncbi:hypothetical protein CSUI_005158 [Cystoisospora suis]|uniref:Transmembrane protein n=1 Tax=Cystoisospora suis TaxID=483139 RepID=A0A2C6KKG8_9APIC|nr:hypothetical protein CSUI_005158 [Cystoisospora suis]
MEKKNKKNLRVTFAMDAVEEESTNTLNDVAPKRPMSPSRSGKGSPRSETGKPLKKTRPTDKSAHSAQNYSAERSTVFEPLPPSYSVPPKKAEVETRPAKSEADTRRRRHRRKYERKRSADSEPSSASRARSPTRLASESHHTIKVASRIVGLILWGAVTTLMAMAIARFNQPRPAPVLLVKVVQRDSGRLPLKETASGSGSSFQLHDKELDSEPLTTATTVGSNSAVH